MHASTNRPLWNIPYQRNPFFTGREDVLSQLHHALHAENAVALSHPQGISGLGGIGKTQTALEYAYRYEAEYDAVFWVQADSAAALTSGYVTLAQLLRLPERDEQDQRIIVEAVLRWLRVHTGWLLVFDSTDDLTAAEPFLPKAGRGHVLFTTRAHALGRIAQRLEIQQKEPETGALLLLHKANILPLQSVLDGAVRDDRRVACEISQELDGLPLALDQAGSYVKETPCSLMDYFVRYRIRRQDLLQARGNLNLDYPASVATTWSLSFEKVSQANPAAAELLNFCAFLAHDAIPEEILTAGASHLGAILAPVAANPMQLDQSCKEVLRFSLFQRGADVRTLTIHRLVQAVLQDNLPAETCAYWKQRAVLSVSAASPNVQDVAQWDACEQWLPHALVCATWIEQTQMTIPEAARLLNGAGSYLDERARYPEAEPLYRQALAINEQQLDSEHPETATSLNNLALLYYHQGKYAEAEPLYQRALAIDEQQSGTVHPDTASSLSNLAELYRAQGRYEQAESLLKRVLAIHEQQLGINHPSTARSLNNMAALYYHQGKYAEAEPLYQRALAIREQQLGTVHPDTAQTLNNLALLYHRQGKYAEAEPLYQRALAIYEQQLGTDHPDTVRSLNNLAELYEMQGKYAEAEPLLVRALAIREQQLGTDHPSTATSLNNLALLYHHQGKYKQAEALYMRALTIYEQQLGADHPDTARSLINLAELYQVQGKHNEAELLLVRALTIYEQQLGTDHPDTAQTLNNLALLYHRQGKYAEAEPLLVRALAIYEQQLGADHPDTARSLINLAGLYQVQGKHTEAVSLYQRALTIYEQQLGVTQPEMTLCLNNLAILYTRRGRFAEAVSLYRRALQITEQQLGPDHPNTQKIRKNYATLKMVRSALYLFLFLMLIVCLITWLFHKFDLLGWIALVFAVLSGLRLAIDGYMHLLKRSKRQPTPTS
jgi:tetratricopeptide (TPR) repeat protein